VPGGRLILENKTSFAGVGAPSILDRKIPTPSQYTSKWPLAVAAGAGRSEVGMKSMIRLRKM
jgi:hypothetical protein